MGGICLRSLAQRTRARSGSLLGIRPHDTPWIRLLQLMRTSKPFPRPGHLHTAQPTAVLLSPSCTWPFPLMRLRCLGFCVPALARRHGIGWVLPHRAHVAYTCTTALLAGQNWNGWVPSSATLTCVFLVGLCRSP